MGIRREHQARLFPGPDDSMNGEDESSHGDDSSHPSTSRAGGAKALGAYYTDAQIADFLAWWAIRSANATVLDPCFGGGVFLRSACKRLAQIGGKPETQVLGVEVDPEVYHRISEKVNEEYGVKSSNLINKNFFWN
jgi:hypothetical protein